ncbi:MAG: hypothetical protein LBI05_11515 [Planctomycetaceae bacterium]|jgi:hypothetical protein|nr:hypothetical protein [Planctomycetaceae bacterium]
MLTKTERIANPSIMLTLADGFGVPMRQLTIGRMADLDAYVRGKFMQNTFKALEGLDPDYRSQVIQNMAVAAQQLTWSDKAATVIFETEEDGLAFYTFKHVESDFKGNFNGWKERFNHDRDGNANLFYAARWALYFSSNPAAGEEPKDPDILYKWIDKALLAGLPLNIILESTPSQIAMLIGDRKAMENMNDGKVHFRDQAEFRAWVEERSKES